ncbi:MAG: macro domain-containing protein [Acidobacteriaceae bacterium]
MNQALLEYTFPTGQVLQLVHGDITAEKVDAIVNAANRYLQHGAGVAGAIVRKGGPVIQAESDQWVRTHGLVSHAQPAYTQAGNLPCQYVIHAVGPVWGDGNEDDKLSVAIRGSMQLADKLELSSIALPALSTGIFGFPMPRAAQVILTAILEYIERTPGTRLKLIRLVLYERTSVQAFSEVWEQDDHFAA